MPRRSQLMFAALAVVTVVYLGLLTLGPTEALTRTPEYQLPLLRHGLPSKLPAAALILALGLLPPLLLLANPQARPGRARVYAALFFSGLACQLGPASVHRMGLAELPLRVFLPDHTSYFTDAAKIKDLRVWLRDFPDQVPSLATHSRTHPPGAVLLFHFPIRAMRAMPAVSDRIVGLIPRGETAASTFQLDPGAVAAGILCALALVLIAAAAVPLTFALARVFLDDRRALAATALFAAMPAFSHKTPVLDHLLGLTVLFAAWLCLSALEQRRIWRIAAAGALTGAGLWLGTATLAAFPLCFLFLACGIHRYRRENAPARAHLGLLASLSALFLGSAGALLVGVGAGLELNFIDVYRAITESGWRFNNEISGRLHAWMWVGWDPYELLIFAGLPAGLLALVAFAREGFVAGARRWRDALPWVGAIGFFLAALVLSAKVVYEASRLAWFAFPLIAMAAASTLPELEDRQARLAALVMVGLTGVSALVFRLLF